MKPVLFLGALCALSTGCTSVPQEAVSPDAAEISALTSIEGHSDYIWKEMPWGVIVASTDAEVASAIEEYDAANTALSQHFDLIDQRGAIVVNSIATERAQIERVFDLDWMMPWDFSLDTSFSEQSLTAESRSEPSAAQKTAIRQQIVEQLSAGGAEPDPAMVERLYQMALEQMAEPKPMETANEIKPLRHELGHMIFVHGVWAIDNEAQQYASGAPDWLDETAAVLAEDPVLTQRRRDHVKQLVLDKELMSFEKWFAMEHPVYGAALELIAQKVESDGDEPTVGAYLFTAEDFEAAGLDIDANAADFYAISRGFIDYLDAKSTGVRALQIITQDLKEGANMDEILRDRGDQFGLPLTIEDLDRDFAEWITGRA